MTMPDDQPPPRRTPSAKLLAALALACVALAGILGGIALDRFVLMPRHFGHHGRGPFEPGERGGAREPSRRMADRFAKELDLTPAQRTAVDTLMARQFSKMGALRERVRPAMDSIIGETQRQIDVLLTPAQREKLKTMRDRLGRRDGDRDGRGPPPPPFP